MLPENPDLLFDRTELPTAIQEALSKEHKPFDKTTIPLTPTSASYTYVRRQGALVGKTESSATVKNPTDFSESTTVVVDRPNGKGWDAWIESEAVPYKTVETTTSPTPTTSTTPTQTVIGPVLDTYKPGAAGSMYKAGTYTGSYSYTPLPKWISAGVVVFRGTGLDTKVLLCRPKGAFSGKYTLSKGRIEKNETSFKAAIRETLEETGVVVEIIPDTYLGLYEGSSSNTHYYCGTWVSGEPVKTSEMEWAGFLHVADALNYLRNNPRDKKALFLAYKMYQAHTTAAEQKA